MFVNEMELQGPAHGQMQGLHEDFVNPVRDCRVSEEFLYVLIFLNVQFVRIVSI